MLEFGCIKNCNVNKYGVKCRFVSNVLEWSCDRLLGKTAMKLHVP
jgi:hypothetical protein